MRFSLITTATVIGLTLTGCGGGGGSSSAAAPSATQQPAATQTPATPSPAAVDPQPAPQTPAPEPVIKAADLVLANEFALNSHVEVPVQIDVSGLNNNTGYLSICPALNPDDSNSEPDYDNCFVRTALPESVYDSSLDLSTTQGIAYSAIWFLDQTEEAIITRHDLSAGAISVME